MKIKKPKKNNKQKTKLLSRKSVSRLVSSQMISLQNGVENATVQDMKHCKSITNFGVP